MYRAKRRLCREIKTFFPKCFFSWLGQVLLGLPTYVCISLSPPNDIYMSRCEVFKKPDDIYISRCEAFTKLNDVLYICRNQCDEVWSNFDSYFAYCGVLFGYGLLKVRASLCSHCAPVPSTAPKSHSFNMSTHANCAFFPADLYCFIHSLSRLLVGQ
jgi:hypothetical protein